MLKSIEWQFSKLQLCHWKVCTCSFFAGISEVIIARDIIPLPVLVPDYNNTVFSSRKEAVWLVWSPVLILLQKREAKEKSLPGLENIYISKRAHGITCGEEQSHLLDSGC